MPSRPPARKSARDTLLANAAADRYYAVVYGKAPQAQPELAPKRTRTAKPRVGPSEHQVQMATVVWWTKQCSVYSLPDYALFAIPNGAARGVITSGRLKWEGVRPGIPDLMLAVRSGRYAGLFIEMKVGANKPSDAQRDVIAYLQSAGYQCHVCYSSEAAIDAIRGYLTFTGDSI